MAVNQIKTRILNKYDSLTNWNNATTFYPRAGEICLANLGTQQVMGANGETRYEPIIGIKVGVWDGVTNSETQKNFSQLQWVQAIAGDVSSFLKGLNKQEDFDTYVKNLINNGYISDVTKDIESLTGRVVALEGTVNDTTSGVAAINTRLTSIDGSISTINGSISTISGNITNLTGTKADKTQVATDIATAKTAVLGQKDGADFNGTVMGAYEAAASAAAAAKKANDAIGSTDYTGGTLTAAIAALQASVGNSSEGLGSQVASLQTRMGQAETAIGTKAAQADLTALQGRVTTAEGKITTLEGEMDVVQAATAGYDASKTIASEIQKANEAIGSAQSKANANEGKINTLVGTDSNKSVRAIAAEETAKIVAGADTNYDTLKEIADWIKSDTTSAAEMANDIAEMQGLLGVIEGEDLPATVDARISAAITNANLGQYASAVDLASVSARVKTIEDAPYATTANVATAKSEVIGASGDAKTAITIYGAKAYADDVAATAKSQAISEAGSAADAKYELKNVAKGLVDALAGTGNTSTVRANADAIASHTATLNAMNVTDAVDGVVTKVDQANGKITVTHKKITMDEFDPDATFIFYCGTASDVI